MQLIFLSLGPGVTLPVCVGGIADVLKFQWVEWEIWQ